MIIRISKKNIIVVLMIIIFIIGCLIWYGGELGTNREVPKKAKFVSNFFTRE